MIDFYFLMVFFQHAKKNLKNLRFGIRKLLTRHDAEKLVQAGLMQFIIRISKQVFEKLPADPKCSRVPTDIATKKKNHMTPLLASLHWLSIKPRTVLKIILLT